VRSYPKPLQQPGPPVLLGSKDKNALKRVAQWGDGWCPNRVDPAYMKEHLAILKDECCAAGRDYGKLDITVMGALPGERGQVQEELAKFAELGVGRFVCQVGTLGPDDYQQRLENLARTWGFDHNSRIAAIYSAVCVHRRGKSTPSSSDSSRTIRRRFRKAPVRRRNNRASPPAWRERSDCARAPA
jgi:hypothetical protein